MFRNIRFFDTSSAGQVAERVIEIEHSYDTSQAVYVRVGSHGAFLNQQQTTELAKRLNEIEKTETGRLWTDYSI